MTASSEDVDDTEKVICTERSIADVSPSKKPSRLSRIRLLWESGNVLHRCQDDRDPWVIMSLDNKG